MSSCEAKHATFERQILLVILLIVALHILKLKAPYELVQQKNENRKLFLMVRNHFQTTAVQSVLEVVLSLFIHRINNSISD
jgi:fumarate reductase subunit D